VLFLRKRSNLRHGLLLINTERSVNDSCYVGLSIYLSIALQSFVGPWPLFQFLNLYTFGKTPWTGDQPITRLVPSHRTTQTQNKRTQTVISSVGFEPTIPALERARRVHALDRAGTVTGVIIGLQIDFPVMTTGLRTSGRLW
jgi:hypothetical protein